MMTVKEAASKWNIPENKLRKYCTSGLVFEANKVGNRWRIPDNAVKPMSFSEIKNVLFLVIKQRFKPELSVDFSTVALSYDDLRNKFEYLQQLAYIHNISEIPNERLLCDSILTDKGLQLFMINQKKIDTAALVNTAIAIAPTVIEATSALCKL